MTARTQNSTNAIQSSGWCSISVLVLDDDQVLVLAGVRDLPEFMTTNSLFVGGGAGIHEQGDGTKGCSEPGPSGTASRRRLRG